MSANGSKTTARRKKTRNPLSGKRRAPQSEQDVLVFTGAQGLLQPAHQVRNHAVVLPEFADRARELGHNVEHEREQCGVLTPVMSTERATESTAVELKIVGHQRLRLLIVLDARPGDVERIAQSLVNCPHLLAPGGKALRVHDGCCGGGRGFRQGHADLGGSAPPYLTQPVIGTRR